VDATGADAPTAEFSAESFKFCRAVPKESYRGI
jgi:hypothetical protein